MDIVTLIIQLISGALGGNIAGALFKNISLGSLGNSIAGIVGGGLGGQILGSLLNLPMATDGAAASITWRSSRRSSAAARAAEC